MLFYVASDLHYGHNPVGDRAVEALARHVVDSPVDALLLGGDIAKNRDSTEACLALFEGFSGARLAVPGNHDIWMPGWERAGTSWDIHNHFLPGVFRERGFHPLHLEPLEVDEVTFVGSMGWYDYSFRDEEIGIPLSCYRKKTPPWARHAIWSDARFASFPQTDEALTRKLVGLLGGQLQEARSDTVVALVHHVVTKKLLVHPRERVPKKWRFANAFLGSERLGDVLAGDPRVEQIFCGHIHLPMHAVKGGARCTTVGGDYKKKQLLLATPMEVVGDLWFT